MTQSEKLEIETARREAVAGIVGALSRLAKARPLLTQAQRFEISDMLRNVADDFDLGVGDLLRQVRTRTSKPVRRLVRSGQVDAAGRQLYRVE
jgi:hypothetical protein